MPVEERKAEAVVDVIGAQHYRRDLYAHCRRMLGSPHEAEDAVQETYLRAWRARATFAGDAAVRTWLYRIATNVCLDLLRARTRAWRGAGERAVEVPWFGAGPEQPAEDLAADDDPPDTVVVARETVELAVLAAVQVLPPRQRAALILRDVLGQPAADTAAVLDTSVAAANSALQRARATMHEHLPSGRLDWATRDASPRERVLVERLMDAHDRRDAGAGAAAALAS
jgi:RNA polymerase sigma-70 factor (TIGR02960 family)